MPITNPAYKQYTTSITLGSGQNNDSEHVDVLGARAVSFTVSASDTSQLTTASPQAQLTDGKQVTCAPAALPAGASQAAAGLNAGGIVTGLDLSTTTPRLVMLRAAADSSFQVESSPKMYGVTKAWLTLTRAAVASTTVYTVVTTVYY
jgi:hypothetical protein